MKKRLFLFAAIAAICVCLFAVGASAVSDTVVASGTCGAQGDNLTWVLYDDGELVISGEGEMANWHPVFSMNFPLTPWYSLNYKINTVTIESGATSVGNGAFLWCNMTNITIPDSVTSIGDAFYLCSELTDITIYSRNATFYKNVFSSTNSSSTIHAYAGSTAEAYARAHGHAFVALPEPADVTITAPTAATVTAPTDGFIEGENTFNVSCDNPCRVFVSNDGGETYERLTATANANSGYDFTATLTAESEIVVRLVGDITGNGALAVNDFTRAKSIFLDSNYATDAINRAMLDTDGDGRILVNDLTLIRRILLGYVVAW